MGGQVTRAAGGERGGRRLRVVVFTAGALAPVNRVFFERLAREPGVDLCGIVVDEYRRPRKGLAARARAALREDGWGWLGFKLAAKGTALLGRLGLALFERGRRRVDGEQSYEALSHRSAVPVYRVADIHGEESLALIRSLAPDLGVIVGGRILRESVITIPGQGTLNIHKRKVPEYRGGGPVGYWEVLAGERSIGVTIHYATARVDAGPVLAEATIPVEECDTLESLGIKADLLGARLYLESIRRVAAGRREGRPQDQASGRTYRAPSEFQVWKLERRLKRKAARLMPAGPSPAAAARVLLQYALALPLLRYHRRRLARRRRLPIATFFYHVVTNRPVNHLCLPLHVFARQMEFLTAYYRVVSLDEAVARLASGANDELAAVLTFDDGYRDNVWALEYLRYYDIPATFFVSIGHVRDGRPFDHDRRRGFEQAAPMSVEDVRRLAADGFLVGSHAVYHEDFGALDPGTADEVLREGRDLIRELIGPAPEHFSFPKGLRRVNITAESFALAQKHFRYIHSAYGGYNFPVAGRSHFLRMPNPGSVLELALLMDGYRGFRACLGGDAWGIRTDTLPPY